MKTIVLSLCMLMLGTTSLVAKEGEKKGGDPVKKDSTEVKTEKQSAFEVTVNNGSIEITIDGEFDPYASVSLATNRGSDIYFTFLKSGSNEISFDTSNLDEGSYYVILNSNEEVRIKRFQKN